MTYDERAARIDELCKAYDAARGRNDYAEMDRIDGILVPLTCAQGTCDHYTCTEGESLAEWERSEIARGAEWAR